MEGQLEGAAPTAGQENKIKGRGWDHENSETQRRGPGLGCRPPEEAPILGSAGVSELEEGFHGTAPRVWKRGLQQLVLVSLKGSEEAGCAKQGGETVHWSQLLLAGRCAVARASTGTRAPIPFLLQLSRVSPAPPIIGA